MLQRLEKPTKFSKSSGTNITWLEEKKSRFGLKYLFLVTTNTAGDGPTGLPKLQTCPLHLPTSESLNKHVISMWYGTLTNINTLRSLCHVQTSTYLVFAETLTASVKYQRLGWSKDFKGIVKHFCKYTHLLCYSELDEKK